MARCSPPLLIIILFVLRFLSMREFPKICAFDKLFCFSSQRSHTRSTRPLPGLFPPFPLPLFGLMVLRNYFFVDACRSWLFSRLSTISLRSCVPRRPFFRSFFFFCNQEIFLLSSKPILFSFLGGWANPKGVPTSYALQPEPKFPFPKKCTVTPPSMSSFFQGLSPLVTFLLNHPRGLYFFAFTLTDVHIFPRVTLNSQ